MTLLRRNGISDQTGHGTGRPTLQRSFAARRASLPRLLTHRASRLAVRGDLLRNVEANHLIPAAPQYDGPACIPGRRRGASGMRSPQFVIGMLNVVWLGDVIKILWCSGEGLNQYRWT